MTAKSYKRVLLKISGEQLAGKYDGGFDAEHALWFLLGLCLLKAKYVRFVFFDERDKSVFARNGSRAVNITALAPLIFHE